MTALKLYLIRACNLVAEFISDRILQHKKIIPEINDADRQTKGERERKRVLPVAMEGKPICFEVRMNLSLAKFLAACNSKFL